MARELRFRFPLPRGLHARPASALRDAAAAFRSAITLTNHRSGRSADTRSVLALVATLSRRDDACTLTISGDDEADALAGMRRFVAAELPLCDEAEPAVPPAPGGNRPLPRALRRDGVTVLRGRPASGGIGRGKALPLLGRLALRGAGEPAAGTPEEEAARLERALDEVGADLRRTLRSTGDATARSVLEAHLAILEDVELRATIERGVRAGGLSAGRAVEAAADHFAGVLREAGTALLAERALDVHDVAARLARAVDPDLAADDDRIVLDRDTVLVAPALSPARLLAVDSAHLRGLVLAAGGATSHTAILARARGIPCVIGVADAVGLLGAGRDVVVDGERGVIVADAPPEVGRFYATQAALLRALQERRERVAARPAATADKRSVEVAANAGSLPEVREALAAGAEGIGLFRTELLFMERDEAPSEDEQTAVYAEAARLAGGRPVVIRTLDAGGDKPIPYLDLPYERDPFLGSRAIRLYEAHREIAAAQLRAILRASAAGHVKVMFPMVSSLEEVRTLRAMVAEQMDALAAAGVPFDRDIGIGIMVEVPALAFAIADLAPEVGFFSIGSNDLLQYLLAVARDNERVAHLYDPYRPAFVRALATICAGARAAGRPIGLCGELAADPLAVPLLVGLGLDELSVGAAHLAAVKSVIAGVTSGECRGLAEAVTAATTSEEVDRLLRAFAARAAASPPLAPELVRLRSASSSKEEAIRELVDMLQLGGRVEDADLVEDAVWRREATYSTGIGLGLALPHCTSEAVIATSIAVATYEDGVDWQALDGEPVRMAVLVAVAASAAEDEHLRTIAGLSRRLVDDELREALLAAGSAGEVVELLRGARVE